MHNFLHRPHHKNTDGKTHAELHNTYRNVSSNRHEIQLQASLNPRDLTDYIVTQHTFKDNVENEALSYTSQRTQTVKQD